MSRGVSTATDQDGAWRDHARRLADRLVDAGDIRDSRWAAAVAAVPRHHLVPVTYRQDRAGVWLATGHAPDGWSPGALQRVYSTDTLVSCVQDGAAVSSSTKPDLMARMLEVLAIEDGMRVLEIGTGTGYNAALLCHRLGDQHVFSVDVEPDLVATAQARLAAIGVRPHLAARDGQTGWPEHAPYDRIIATCSIPAVPWSWAEQLRPGGLVLADIKLGPGAGNLVLLRRTGHQLQGRFTGRWAGFMAARSTPAGTASPPRPRAAVAGTPEVSTSETATPPEPWATHREAWMLAALRLPTGVVHGYTLDPATRDPRAARLSAPDGSWCEVALAHRPAPGPDGRPRWQLTEAGPTKIWAAVEDAYRDWRAAGQPSWERFGLTVTTEHTRLWLDHPTTVLGQHAQGAETVRWRPMPIPPGVGHPDTGAALPQ